MAKALPSINVQHEYITVNFGNGRRLTASFGGAKASGVIPTHVWKAWLAMIDSPTPQGVENAFLAKIQGFANNIGTIWPEWNKPPREFTIGEKVKLNFGPRRGGMKEGIIEKKVRTNYTVRFEGMGLVSVSGDLLESHNQG